MHYKLKLLVLNLLLFYLVPLSFSQQKAHQKIINRGSGDVVYARLTNLTGKSTTSELVMAKGAEAYLDEKGKLMLAIGQHKLININGRGQYIGITPRFTELYILFGFRINRLFFHCEKDSLGFYQTMCDSIENHGNKISGGLNEKEFETTFESMVCKDGFINLVGVKAFPFLTISNIITSSNKPKITALTNKFLKKIDSEWKKMVIGKDGIINEQIILVRLFYMPTSGDAETLASNVIFLNDYKNNLRLIAIKDEEKNVTSYVMFDKGQSAYFDKNGHLIFGTGTFRLVNVDNKGQFVSSRLLL